MDASVEERFWGYVTIRGFFECWEWTGGLASDGYGRMRIGHGRRLRASRLMWESWHGVSPGPLFVCHRCDNPLCVNPHHLFLGTHQDNMRDRDAKKRHAFGERNGGGVKLTEAQVREILRHEESQEKLARRFGVSQRLVSAIHRGVIWKHVSPEIPRNRGPVTSRS